jgi:hypothetical protein
MVSLVGGEPVMGLRHVRASVVAVRIAGMVPSPTAATACLRLTDPSRFVSAATGSRCEQAQCR